MYKCALCDFVLASLVHAYRQFSLKLSKALCRIIVPRFRSLFRLCFRVQNLKRDASLFALVRFCPQKLVETRERHRGTSSLPEPFHASYDLLRARTMPFRLLGKQTIPKLSKSSVRASMGQTVPSRFHSFGEMKPDIPSEPTLSEHRHAQRQASPKPP